MNFDLFKNPLVKPAIAVIMLLAAIVLFLGDSISVLIALVKSNDAYTHLAVIPFISAFFAWSSRAGLRNHKGSMVYGSILIAVATLGSLLIYRISSFDPIVPLALRMTALYTAGIGIILFFWGVKVIRNSLFAFIFLLFAIPLPSVALAHIITFLQNGSALMVDWIFTAAAQTYIREGLTFHLESLSIYIAPECSGIRSTMALVITAAMASEMMLKSWKLKICAILLIVPLSLLKNAVRISTITLLAQYVDMSFLTDSFLHKGGGIFFYLFVLAIFFPSVYLLSRLESKKTSSPS